MSNDKLTEEMIRDYNIIRKQRDDDAFVWFCSLFTVICIGGLFSVVVGVWF